MQQQSQAQIILVDCCDHMYIFCIKKLALIENTMMR